MPGDALLLTHVYLLGVISAIAMGLLMRAVANPSEAAQLKRRIRELEDSLPPKHLRTPKMEKKVRVVESELRRLRRRYSVISLKRLTAMFAVYGLTLAYIFLKLPPLLSSPIRLPLLTYEVEGRALIPVSIVYIMVVLLLSPVSLRIAEPPVEQAFSHGTRDSGTRTAVKRASYSQK